MWPFNLLLPLKKLFPLKNRRERRSTRHPQHTGRPRRATVSLELEALEDRVLMTASPIYFTTQHSVSQNVNDTALYRGTPSGNTPIKDFGNDNVYSLTVVGSKAYFIVSVPFGSGTVDNQLWVSDGTSAGTEEVYDAGTSGVNHVLINILATIGNKIEFTLPSSNGTDSQLWVSDGTSGGTFLVKNLNGDPNGPQQVVGSQLYFTTSTTDNQGNSDYHLYVSDGTSAGTIELADTGSGQDAAIFNLTAVGGKLAFAFANGNNGDPQLWATNGTVAGTGMVFDTNGNDINGPMVAVGSNLYFDEQIAIPGTNNYDNQLWVSNLTITGNTLLRDFGKSEFEYMVATGNQAYINVGVFSNSNTEDYQLWSATPSGATRLADGNSLFAQGTTSLGDLTPVGNQLYFVAENFTGTNLYNNVLYVSSGTPSTTIPLYNFGNGVSIRDIGVVSSQVYIFTFSPGGNTADFKIYTSNGTPAGTLLLADLGANDPSSALVGTSSQVYFSTFANTTFDYRLYTSDGTTAGTTYTDFGSSPLTGLAAVTISFNVGAEFPGTGVWLYSGGLNSWQQLTRYDAISVAAGNNGVAAAFGSDGTLWLWTAQASWTLLSTHGASQVAINDANQIAAIFPSGGLWLYDPSQGWRQLTTYTPFAVTIDDNGTVSAAFVGGGLWTYNATTGWRQLTPYTPSMIAAGTGYLVAEFPGGGVWLYNNAASSWQQLSSHDATSIAVDAQGDVLAAFGGAGVWSYRAGAWSQISSAVAQQVSLDENGDIFADFATGLQEYVSGSWTTLTGHEPSQFSV